MDDKPVIDHDKLPMFTAVGFTLALLALVVALIGIHRTNVTVAATQLEVLALNQKITDLGKQAAVPTAPAAPATQAPAK